MLSCNAAELLYNLVPLKSCRALLVRAHFDRCPRCQQTIATAPEARSFLLREADAGSVEAVWEGVVRSLAAAEGATAAKPAPFPGLRWRWAAACLIVACLAGYWVWRGARPGAGPATASAPARFELEYVRVGGQPADAYVYQPQGSDMIIVWAGKAN